MPVDKSSSRVRRMFAEIAPRYDLLNRMLSGGTDVYWRWRTVRTVAPAEEGPILDVCTGTGDLALAYWKRSGGRLPVVGTDFTHEMLMRADRKVQQASEGRQSPDPFGEPSASDQPAAQSGDSLPPLAVTLLEADTQRLPFNNDLFQIVCVAFGLRNVTDTRQGLREMVRVCRPGGRVAVLEFSEPTGRLFRRVYHAYFQHVLPRIGQLVARNREEAYNYLPSSVSEFPSGQALADLMTQCGLSEVRFQPLTGGIATLYYGVK